MTTGCERRPSLPTLLCAAAFLPLLQQTQPAIQQVLDLNLDLSGLPQSQADLLPKRVLGPRWYETTAKRQADIVAGRQVISLQEWRQRCEQTRVL